MPFWLNDNKFFAISRRLSMFHRLGITLLCLILVFLGWFLMSYFPLQLDLKSISSNLCSCEKQKETHEKTLSCFYASEKKLKHERDIYDKLIAQKQDKQEFSGFIFTQAKKYNVRCDTMNYLGDKKYDSLELKVHACFNEIVSFLREIHRSYYPVVFTKLILDREKENDKKNSITAEVIMRLDHM